MDVVGLLAAAHVPEVQCAAPDVVADVVEVNVGDVFFLAELPDDGRDERVVRVVHAGEQVVLDLVVETAVQVAEPPAANVGGRNNLERDVDETVWVAV